MSFLIKYEKLLEKHNEFLKNVSNIIKKEFDSKPVHNKKYLKTKIKFYNGKIDTNFHKNKIPNECFQCIFLSVILNDSVYGKDNHCPQVFVRECKYVVKEKKTSKFITDNIEISSDDSDKEDSDEENFNEENSDEENEIWNFF